MLSIEENDLLTRTGPGTAMGELFRRFWIPALLSSELPERDCPPVRFTLLGERLVAFRATSGNVGVLEERCPHRRTSLYWGRNEQDGIRCAYHGWKFDTEGNCLDQPAELDQFCDQIKIIAYPTHEAGGVIFTYMGPPEVRPPFPDFEFTLLPKDHSAAGKRYQVCNWLQNLEGELDTAHVNFLHRSWDPQSEEMMPDERIRRKRYFVAETDFGLLCMARSEINDREYYWRMTPFMLPSFTCIPRSYDGANTLTAAVPADDTHMWGFTVSWHHNRPLQANELASAIKAKVDQKTWIPEANMTNDYLRDINRQKNGSWSGIDLIRIQDLAVQEDQDGPVCRRFEEHLGTTDRAIVGGRRLLLNLAEKLRQGIEPAQAHLPHAYRVRSVAENARVDVDPVEVWRRGQPALDKATAIGAVH
jgi:phthalate 4,5-dioxygenase